VCTGLREEGNEVGVSEADYSGYVIFSGCFDGGGKVEGFPVLPSFGG
jgi:hypothetical protein